MERLQNENAELRKRLGMPIMEVEVVSHVAETSAVVHSKSPTSEKIKLFRSLFRGREDVYAIYWTNERTGKHGYFPACENRWDLIALPLQKKCRIAGNTEFLDTNDPKLWPWKDQWAFLSGIERMPPAQLEILLTKIPPVTVGPGTMHQTPKSVCGRGIRLPPD